MKRINLDQMKNMSIDNLIESYRSGYRLEEHTPITSLSNLPNFSNIHTLQGQLLDPVVNFGKVIVSIGYDAVATSIILNINEGSKLPDSSSVFNLVWWNSTDYPDPSDDPNKEIVRCTARTTDTLTVTRAQEGTSATTKNTVGKIYKMILSPTAKMMSDISSAITARVVKSGDTMTGTLNLPANGLIVGTDQLIVSGGNVGLGTTNPTYKLTVVGDVDISSSIASPLLTSRASSGIAVDLVGTTGIKLSTRNTANAKTQRFAISDQTDTANISIINSNVGIGTTNPGANLHIASDSVNDSFRILHTNATTGITFGYTTIKTFTTNTALNIGTYGTGTLTLNALAGAINLSAVSVGFTGNNANSQITITNTGSASLVSGLEGTLGILGTSTNNSFSLRTNNADRVRIDTAGNVGIGTTIPTSLLDVHGTTQLRGYVGGTGLTVDAGGNVGIGTTSPGAKLDIRGANVVTDSNGNVSICTTDVQAINKGGQLSLGGSALDAGTGFAYFGTIAGRKENSISGNYAGYITLGTMSSTGTNSEKMRINSTGNVGIGTTVPVYKLDVNGEIGIENANGISFVNVGATDVDRIYKVATNQMAVDARWLTEDGTIGATGWGFVNDTDTGIYRPADNQLGFVVGASEKVRIDSSGNVGIGITNPAEKLTANGNIMAGTQARIYATVPDGQFIASGVNSPGTLALINTDNNDWATAGEIRFGTNVVWTDPGTAIIKSQKTGGGVYGHVKGNLIFRIHDEVAGVGGLWRDAMTIISSGNVGIGTTSPTAKLHIDSNGGSANILSIQDSVTNLGSITVRNDARAMTLTGQPIGSDFSQATLVVNAVGIGSANRKLFGLGVASSERFSVDVEGDTYIYGNVGIGITTPTSKLQTSGSFSAQVTTISGSVTLDETYYTVLCNAGTAFTVTLPDASTCPGRIYNIKKKDSSTNTVTIATTGGQTIDGVTSRSINIQYETVSTQSDGIQWWIV